MTTKAKDQVKKHTKDQAKDQTYHHGDLRNALVSAGASILKEDGVSALTLRKVARKANVSHTAPYRHFKGKDDLLAVIATQGFGLLTEGMQKVLDQHAENPRQALLALGENYVNFGITYPEQLELMFGNILHNGSYPDLNQAASQTFNLLLETVKAGQEVGIIKAGDANQLAIAQWSIVHGMSTLFKKRLLENQKPKDFVRVTIEHLMKGLES